MASKKFKQFKELTVIKVGGTLLAGTQFPRLVQAVAGFLKKTPAVLVHGGGKEITALCEKLQIQTRFVHGRRFTDEKTMEAVEMVLKGKVGPALVKEMNRHGIQALGLSGQDAGLVEAAVIPSLGRVGRPNKVKGDLIRRLLAQNLVPVFASIACDKKGQPLNVNADEMASEIASRMKAFKLILFTDVPGILSSSGRTIPHLTYEEGKKLIEEGTIQGGMIPKVNSAFNALRAGVREVWILHGKLPLQTAKGTLITQKFSSQTHPFL